MTPIHATTCSCSQILLLSCMNMPPRVILNYPPVFSFSFSFSFSFRASAFNQIDSTPRYLPLNSHSQHGLLVRNTKWCDAHRHWRAERKRRKKKEDSLISRWSLKPDRKQSILWKNVLISVGRIRKSQSHSQRRHDQKHGSDAGGDSWSGHQARDCLCCGCLVHHQGLQQVSTGSQKADGLVRTMDQMDWPGNPRKMGELGFQSPASISLLFLWSRRSIPTRVKETRLQHARSYHRNGTDRFAIFWANAYAPYRHA